MRDQLDSLAPQAGEPLFPQFYGVSEVNMGKNTNFTYETIPQIVQLHAVDHHTKEIMDLIGVSHTSVLVVAFPAA